MKTIAALSLFVLSVSGDAKPLLAIDDFEDAKKSAEGWVDESAVKQKPEVSFVEGREKGKKGMRIVFHKNAKGGASIAHYLGEKETWPAEGTVLAFWVKSDRKTKFRIKINELRGGAHSTFEGHSVEVEATAEWREVKVNLSQFAYLWGHGGGNKKVDPKRIGMIAFEQIDVGDSLTLHLDDVVVVKP